MYKFSDKSLKKLETCHDDLQRLMMMVMRKNIMDFTILEGYRGEEEQNRLKKEGKSNARYGQSKHNLNPSHAVDIAPYPIDWQDTERFALLAGIILSTAKDLGINIRWGGDFKSIKDMPHFELI